MGTDSTKRAFKVSTKGKRKGDIQCGNELANFFNCLTRVSDAEFDNACARDAKALTDCANAAAKTPKVRNTINFHLQRLAKGLKRR